MTAITAPVPDQPFVADNELELWRATRSAVVFVGETESAGDPPGLWSGDLRAGQIVVTRVVEPICGTAPAPTMTLDVAVVQGARTAADIPALADWITRPGSHAVYLVQDGQVIDEDLGILPADPALVMWLRAACSSDTPPPGIPGVLHVFSELAAGDTKLAAVFANVPPSVLDIDDARHTVARVTVSHGELRLFTGVRRDRVVRSRRPDIRMRATARELARVLSGELPPEGIIVEGEAAELVRALATAAARIKATPRSIDRLRVAAGG